MRRWVGTCPLCLFPVAIRQCVQVNNYICYILSRLELLCRSLPRMDASRLIIISYHVGERYTLCNVLIQVCVLWGCVVFVIVLIYARSSYSLVLTDLDQLLPGLGLEWYILRRPYGIGGLKPYGLGVETLTALIGGSTRP